MPSGQHSPEYRGRGLGTAVTGAVARALMERGARDVVLNVREDNAAAIAAYSRLGFTVHEPFWEGNATLRQGSAETPDPSHGFSRPSHD